MYSQLLTQREKEIFEMIINNHDTLQISDKLMISEKTVRNHISNVIQKLGVTNRTQAILELLRIGVLKIKQ